VLHIICAAASFNQRDSATGLANASENSTFADDAVTITDDPEVIASVRKFINGIDEITEVDEVFIDNATRDWEIGREVPIAGVNGRIHDPKADLLPSPVTSALCPITLTGLRIPSP
jgi:hypothetical protein